MAESQTLQLLIKVVGKDEGTRTFRNTANQLKKTETQLVRTRRAFSTFSAGVGKGIKALTGFKAILTGLGITLIARSLINASNEQQKAVLGLEAALRSMGRYTPEISAGLQETARALQKLTNFGDEATLEGTKFLATYRDITDDMMPRTQKAMLDLAALMGGDTRQAANMLGKASMGMTGELRRVGITVDSSTYKLEGYEGVLKAIESQVGGQAEAQRKATGSMIAFGNSVGDTKEILGDFLKLALEPVFKTAVEAVDEFNDRMKEAQKTQGWKDWAAQVSEIFIATLGRMAKAAAVVADVFRGWKYIFLGLKGTFALLAETFERATDAMALGLQDFFKWVGRALQKIGAAIESLPFKKVSKAVGEAVKEAGKYLEINTKTGVSGKQVEYWRRVSLEVSAAIEEMNESGTATERVTKALEKLQAKAREYTEELRTQKEIVDDTKPQPVGPPQATEPAKIKSELTRFQADAETTLATLDAMYDLGIAKYEEYFERRKEIARKAFEEQLRTLEAQKDLERDPDKVLAIEDQIYALKEEYSRKELELFLQKNEAIKNAETQQVEVSRTLAEMRNRVQFDSATNLTNVFRQQQLELANEQENEIQRLRDLKASEAEIEEAHRLHQLERDKQIADQRMQIQDLVLDNMKKSLGFMESAFRDAYEASGKKIKEFAVAQKAVAIVQATIDTYLAAQKAYSSLVGIPYVGPALAVVAAAAAIAAGMARVAAIRSQQFAEGGVVKGHSPHKKADNIPINATAGEVVSSVDTSQYYGYDFFEALKQKAIPKAAARALLSGMSIPPMTLNPSVRFAAGGRVADTTRTEETKGGKGEQQQISVVNVLDPNLMDQYVSTTHGKKTMLNFISQNSYSVRQILSQG